MNEQKRNEKKLEFAQKHSHLFAKAIPNMSMREKKALMKYYALFTPEELYKTSHKHFGQAMAIYEDMLHHANIYRINHHFMGFIAKNIKNTYQDYSQAVNSGANINELTFLFFFLFKTTLLLAAEAVCLPVTIPLEIRRAIYNRVHNPLKDTKDFANALYNYVKTHEIGEKPELDERIVNKPGEETAKKTPKKVHSSHATHSDTPDLSTRDPQEIKEIFSIRKRTASDKSVFVVDGSKTDDLLSQTFDSSIMYDDSTDESGLDLPDLPIDVH